MNRILSNKKLLISIFAVLGIIVLISIYFLITIILKFFSPDKEPAYELISDHYGALDSSYSCEYKGKLYYADEQSVYSYPDKTQVGEFDSYCQLSKNDESMFIYEVKTGQLYCYDGSALNKLFKIEIRYDHIITLDDKLIAVSKDMESARVCFKIYDLKTGESIAFSDMTGEKIFFDEQNKDDPAFYLKPINNRYTIIAEKDNTEMIFFEIYDNKEQCPAFIISFNGFCIYRLNDNGFISTEHLNSASETMCEYSIHDDGFAECQNTIRKEVKQSYHARYFYTDNDKLITIGQPSTDHMYRTKKNKVFSDNTQDSTYSSISVYDKTTLEYQYSLEFKDKLIAVKDDTYITFVDGKLIYLNSDSEKTAEKELDDIKEGGSYVFEMNGDCLFVFQNLNNDVLKLITVI